MSEKVWSQLQYFKLPGPKIKNPLEKDAAKYLVSCLGLVVFLPLVLM